MKVTNHANIDRRVIEWYTWSPTFSDWDIIGIALDRDAKKVDFYLNWVYKKTETFSYNNVIPLATMEWVSSGFIINFGQWGQTWLQDCLEAWGRFKYCPPTGFKALSTENLPDTYSFTTFGWTTSAVSSLNTWLVAYWPMDGNYNDASGNGNNWTWQNWVSANSDWVIGNWASFDWSDDYVSIPDSDDWYFWSSDFSINFWWKPWNTSVDQTFVTQGASPRNDNFWRLRYNTTNGLAFDWEYKTWTTKYGVIGAVTESGAGTSYTAGTWYNISLVRTGKTYKLFRNGVEVATNTSSSFFDTLDNKSANLLIGKNDQGGGWPGQNVTWNIDDFAIWKKALSTTEFSQLYNWWFTTYTKNTIKDPSKHFDVLTWTATNAQHDITWLKFQPDLVWWKKRSSLDNNVLVDVIRWSSNELSSNTTSTEYNNTNWVSSFNSDWFSLVWSWNGSWVWNGNTWSTHVAWNWKADWAAVTNNDWSISSQVSANPDAGFSIVSWTWDRGITSPTIGHGLTQAPEMIIIKNRNEARDWTVYQNSISPTGFLSLNTTSASNTTAVGRFEGISNINTFVTGASNETNGTGHKMIAYAFHSVPWYSKVWSYTGNWNADGPFVYTGFKPKYVMVKKINNTGSWTILDTWRDNSNYVEDRLYANLTNTEETWVAVLDFTSNGFKIRESWNLTNTSAWEYIYIAFAEAPFKYANAR